MRRPHALRRAGSEESRGQSKRKSERKRIRYLLAQLLHIFVSHPCRFLAGALKPARFLLPFSRSCFLSSSFFSLPLFRSIARSLTPLPSSSISSASSRSLFFLRRFRSILFRHSFSCLSSFSPAPRFSLSCRLFNSNPLLSLPVPLPPPSPSSPSLPPPHVCSRSVSSLYQTLSLPLSRSYTLSAPPSFLFLPLLASLLFSLLDTFSPTLPLSLS